MDINAYDGTVTGLNGVVEVILKAVIEDPRWVVRWMGWDSRNTGDVRTMTLGFAQEGVGAGSIEIRISEEAMV